MRQVVNSFIINFTFAMKSLTDTGCCSVRAAPCLFSEAHDSSESECFFAYNQKMSYFFPSFPFNARRSGHNSMSPLDATNSATRMSIFFTSAFTAAEPSEVSVVYIDSTILFDMPVTFEYSRTKSSRIARLWYSGNAFDTFAIAATSAVFSSSLSSGVLGTFQTNHTASFDPPKVAVIDCSAVDASATSVRNRQRCDRRALSVVAAAESAQISRISESEKIWTSYSARSASDASNGSYFNPVFFTFSCSTGVNSADFGSRAAFRPASALASSFMAPTALSSTRCNSLQSFEKSPHIGVLW